HTVPPPPVTCCSSTPGRRTLQSESSGGAPAPRQIRGLSSLPPSRQLPASQQQHQHQFHQQQHQAVQEASSPTDQQPRAASAATTAGRQPIPGDVAGPDGGVGGGAPGGGVVGHGAWLSADDHNRLRVMILELVNRALMPWLRRLLKLLNEQIASRMRGKGIPRGGSGSGGGAGKGVGRSMFGSGGSLAAVVTPREAAAGAAVGPVGGFGVPVPAVRSRCSISALRGRTMEMAALSAFMQEGTSQRNYPHPYMENAIATYLQNCKNQLLATRGTFLSAEALKTKKMYAEAAVQYIKMTTEDSDLRSALLLEQAAHCYPAHAGAARAQVRIPPPHPGWSPVLQSRPASSFPSLAIGPALRVYRTAGWTLAEDPHQPAFAALRELESAKDSAYRLLRHDSRQSPAQQSTFLRDFVHVYREFIPTVASPPDYCLIGGALPVLPLPKSRSSNCCLSRPSSQLDDLSIPARGVHFQDADLCHPEWSGLERALPRSGHWPFCAAIWLLLAEPLTYQIPLRATGPDTPHPARDVCLLWSLRRTNGGGRRDPRPIANAAA
uniref:Non-specific serine/threonine protein kinase n=1 Tax=Macrostomum lignano TaxID=282301 RepID=A0A1I8FM60_9PLAT